MANDSLKCPESAIVFCMTRERLQKPVVTPHRQPEVTPQSRISSQHRSRGTTLSKLELHAPTPAQFEGQRQQALEVQRHVDLQQAQLEVQRSNDARLSQARVSQGVWQVATSKTPAVQRALFEHTRTARVAVDTRAEFVVQRSAQHLETLVAQRLKAELRPSLPAAQRQADLSLSHVAEHLRDKAEGQIQGDPNLIRNYQGFKNTGAALVKHFRSPGLSHTMGDLAGAIQRFTDPGQRGAVESAAFAALGHHPSFPGQLQRALDAREEGLELQRETWGRELEGTAQRLAEEEASGEGATTLIEQARGGGQPLPENVRAMLEVKWNTDLSKVRVHTDDTADGISRKLNAKALTTGNDIFFRAGTWNPTSLEGLQLIAHETWHTMQQANNLVQAGIDRDAGLETEARGKGSEVSSQDVQTVSITKAKSAVNPTLKAAASSSSTTRAVQRDKQSALSNNASATRETSSAASKSSVQQLNRAYQIARLLNNATIPEVRELQGLIRDLLNSNQFNAALDAIHEVNSSLTRAKVLSMLMIPESLSSFRTQMTVQALGGIEQVTFDAFVEQLTSFMVYGNNSDFSNLKNPANPKDGVTKILSAFGYTATPAIHGAWGLQMMIFAPISGKAKYKQTILAFRGTEAVKFPVAGAANAASSNANPSAYRTDNESELDSATDFTLSSIAYTQFDTNHGLIADTVKKATRGGNTVVSGHSLGGALAQITAARFPVFQQILTFQAPHVKAEDVDRLEAQKKLRSRNYRMNWDVVPRGGPQPRMAGEIVVFEDQNTTLNTPFASHHTPMLSELLEQTRAEGGKLNPQQAALVDAGKQPPNELSNPGGNANQVRLQQMIPGREDRTLVSEFPEVFFGAQNQNVVANNLLVNVLREVLLPELEKITVASIKQGGGVNALLNRLGQTRRDINGGELIAQARMRAFSSASKEILEAYGNATLSSP